MKKTLLLGGLLTAALARAQAPAWEAVYTLGPVDSPYSDVRVLAADNGGNLYVAGSFTGTIGVGSTLLTAAGSTDAFVAKWSTAARSYVWAQRLGGPGEEHVSAVVVNGGAVYVAGMFRSNSLAFGATTLTNPAGGTGTSGFIARLTDAGSSAAWAWALPVSNSSYEGVRALAVNGTSLYATGAFEGAATTLGPFTLTNVGAPASADLYVAKLTDGGSSAAVTWVANTSAGLTDSERPGGLTVVGSSVYLTGTFTNTARFSPSSPQLSVTAANGGASAFVAKLTDAGGSGSFAWVAATGGAGEAVPLCLAARGSTLYLGGLFRRSPATFGTVSLPKSGVGTDNTSDAFVASLTDGGAAPSFGWALRAGGPAGDSTTALIATDGGVYAVGKFTGAADFGGTTLVASQQQFQPGRYDLFAGRIAETSAGASWAWAQRAGGPAYDAANAVAIGGGRLYVAGSATPVADFGTLSVNGNPLKLGFLATLADQALPARAGTDLPGLALFPSPAHDVATVRVPAGVGPATVQVLDALGRVLQSAPAPAGADYALSVAGLAPGVYAVRVQLGQATAVQRLVVE